MEGSHSGLVRHLGKVVWEQSHRGFKSLTLRQLGNKVKARSGLFLKERNNFAIMKRSII